MIRPIDLDLLGRERRLPPLGVALLALSLALASLLGWRFAQLRGEAALLADRIETRDSARLRPAPVSARAAAGDSAADLKRAQGVLRSLATPWNELFADVEGATGADVGLLGLQPEAVSGRVSISGEARSLDAALRFAERLSAGRALRDAFLAAHEVRGQDAQRPVRFVVSARWRSGGAP